MTSPYWHGMLCAETRAEIAQRMASVLSGKRFTLVVCNSYDEVNRSFSSVEVYPSQWLSGPIKGYRDGLVGLSWHVPRLAMGVHADAKTQAEGRNGGPHGYVHFQFEGEKVTINHYSPARYKLCWIFAVEHHGGEDGGP